TAPLNQSDDPIPEGREPLRLISILTSAPGRLRKQAEHATHAYEALECAASGRVTGSWAIGG
ncbi:MAG TPA: hypothetical protein PKA05_16830, partial [Roseiflexaceae bacterium]|nr:hypothetical protein [Roseiflexaceae bacterium]